MSIAKKSILLIFLVLFVDQASKIYVKTHFVLGEEFSVLSWFKILFVENNGMAFGMELFGKLFLTLFRIAAVSGLAYLIVKLIRENERPGFILTVSLLLAGAAGNIFDSLFYGMIFNDSLGHISTLLPASGGYASFMHGKVVDMLYFPIIKSASGETIFFSPVFNVADSAISVAVGIILIFFRKELNTVLDPPKKQKDETGEN